MRCSKPCQPYNFKYDNSFFANTMLNPKVKNFKNRPTIWLWMNNIVSLFLTHSVYFKFEYVQYRYVHCRVVFLAIDTEVNVRMDGMFGCHCVYCVMMQFNEFQRTVIYAVSLGGDTDTIASMAGAIAGAFYGIDCIPAEWRQACEATHTAEQLANKLNDIVFIENHDKKPWTTHYNLMLISQGSDQTLLRINHVKASTVLYPMIEEHFCCKYKLTVGFVRCLECSMIQLLSLLHLARWGHYWLAYWHWSFVRWLTVYKVLI